MPIHPANQRYKERLLRAPYEICIERARYYTESFKETEGLSPAIRAAKALAHTLEHVTLDVRDEELIAGNRSSKQVGTVLPVERGDINTVLDLELDFLTRRERQPYVIDDADRRELVEEILPWWRGRTMRDRKKIAWRRHRLYLKPSFRPWSLYRRYRSLDLARLREATAVPDLSLSYARRAFNELLYNNPLLVTNVFDVQGHLILGHANVLKTGFIGIRERALTQKEASLRKNDRKGADFLDAVVLCCDAVESYASRLADHLETQARHTDNPERKEELAAMARRCRHVPVHPPRDFHEAVQALWMTQVVGLMSYGMPAIFAVGRLDQMLFPFYERDRREGRIDEAQATRLIEELLIKLATNLLLLPYVGKQTGNELGADSCAPTVGGLDEHGEDAVNDLSFLFLDAFENVESMGNSFTIRLSEKTPESFWKRALGTFRRTSGAALYNDDMAVQALENCGVSHKDALNYGIIGCVEPTGDGDTFGCTSGNDLSLVAALEMALLNGHLRLMGRRIGPRTGNPCRFERFEQLMDVYRKQLRFLIRFVARAVDCKDRVYRDGFPNPFVSSTLSGCVEKARDMTDGGARYDFNSISGRGLGTVVDSLMAIRRFVFEERSISMERLLESLEKNFKGDDVLRERLKTRGPTFGSGTQDADALANDIVTFFCREVSSLRTVRGGVYRPGFFSYGMHVVEGLFLGATPNGRRSGEPVSNSFSPANGAERNGPTAMLRSIASIDHRRISNGCSVNVKLSPSLFKGEERLQKMVDLVQVFFSMGGMELQPNVISSDTLRRAQQHPEEYRGLVVRVSGYSALFTDLGTPLQDEIISRTEFGRL